MATTSDRMLNRKIVEKARKMKSYAYASDDPEISDFAHPSIINIADTMQVAISTGGSSPAMARKIKLKTESFLKKNISSEDIYQIKLQKFARFKAKQVISTQLDRKKFLYRVMNDKRVKELLKEGKYKMAQERVKKMLEELT
jgi:precorrin-2 dehydrogenase/sirohydrochlorin ferrochelatase